MGMSSFDVLLDEVLALVQAKGEYAGIEKLEALKAEGNTDATVCLAVFYLEGLGVIADEEIGLKLLKEAAEAGNPNAYEALGDGYLNAQFGLTEDPQKGQEYMEKAAEAGLAPAIGKCALNYVNGVGVAQNCEKGLEWALRGVKLGDMLSHAVCGDAYFNGMGTPVDISKAAYHYRQIASNDPEDTEVMCDLALCLADPSNELGVYPSQSDISEAFSLLSRAVEMGNVRAHYLLGIVYANGVGVNQDYDLAHHYIELAANNGFDPAQEALGQFRRTMRGTWTI